MVNPAAIGAIHIRVWWYDPRSGSTIDVGMWSGEREIKFTPPDNGPDWVLVVDNASLGYPSPGTGKVAE
jgi:hypothetical protein